MNRLAIDPEEPELVDKIQEVTGHECHIKFTDGRILRFINTDAAIEFLKKLA